MALCSADDTQLQCSIQPRTSSRSIGCYPPLVFFFGMQEAAAVLQSVRSSTLGTRRRGDVLQQATSGQGWLDTPLEKTKLPDENNEVKVPRSFNT